MHGHAQYALGATQETVGNLTGAESWKESGQQNQSAGKQEMQAAGEARSDSTGYGKPEEVLGKAVGCEGMQEEGARTKRE